MPSKRPELHQGEILPGFRGEASSRDSHHVVVKAHMRFRIIDLPLT